MFVYHHKTYDDQNVYRGVKRTYRAATGAAILTFGHATTPFLTVIGSATKTVRVQRITISGLTLTAVAYHILQVWKNSTAPSGGTATTLTNVPTDSANPAATAVWKAYTVGPTAGTPVGCVAQQRRLLQATTAAAAGIPHPDTVFDFRNQGSNDELVLRGVAESAHVCFLADQATDVSMALDVEWTESTE